MYFKKYIALGHAQVLIEGEAYSSVARTNSPTQIIDSDSLMVLDNKSTSLNVPLDQNFLCYLCTPWSI